MTAEKTLTPVWVRREISLITLALLPFAIRGVLRDANSSRARRIRRGAIAIAAIVWSSTIRVVINHRGLEVGFGPWGWPRRLVPLDRIASVRTDRFSPWYWGFGFGYRAVPGHSRVILWPGPGIVVEMTNGHSFGVTVRDARRASDLINEMIQRRDEEAAQIN